MESFIMYFAYGKKLPRVAIFDRYLFLVREEAAYLQ